MTLVGRGSTVYVCPARTPEITLKVLVQVTIEDDMMSVWYFCRSHSVKSAAFSFMTV